MKKDKSAGRLTVMCIILVIILILYTVRIYNIQIVNASTYIEQITGVSTRVVALKAPRGEILDRYGREIAVNREGYNIVFNSAYFRKSDMNKTIQRLIKLLSQSGDEWNDLLPLDKTAPYGFSDSESERKSIITNLDLADYATADDCFKQMVKRYSLEGYKKEEQRLIMGVRYSMEISSFSISNPYIFAEDISAENMTVILESGFMLDGVSVEIAQFREYTDTSFAPHIIGTVGSIPADQWSTKYKPAGYSITDKVGISGIEKSQEETLRGTDGEITYKIDSNGNILSKKITKEPVAGHTVMLTIDKTLQLAAQKKLASAIKDINSNRGAATGGAVVAVNVKSGSILLAATAPSYTSEQLKEDYVAVRDAPNSPLLNRAFNGIYPSGSSLKPAIAIAGLEEKKITSTEIINCTQKYKFYDDYQPSCMHYHGPTSLNNAISKSCNYFFFETGRRIGIKNINKYLKAFGFGQKTGGAEVTDSTGILSEPDSDGNWIGGDTLRVAIGQMNAYTPVQLANYTAVIANGGTRYKTTLIERVMSYDLSTEISHNEAVVAAKVDISDATLTAVKNGMLSVTEDGTGSATFKDYQIKVGGKTGTAQTTGPDHIVFIAFAPFDNPEIAVAVIIEHGAIGKGATSTVKEVLDTYFFKGAEPFNEATPDSVIK